MFSYNSMCSIDSKVFFACVLNRMNVTTISNSSKQNGAKWSQMEPKV